MGFLNEIDSLACFQILWELSSGLSLIAIVVGFSKLLVFPIISGLFSTKYHPAGYSSEYSAGRKFASRIFDWNNTFTYNPENKALS